MTKREIQAKLRSIADRLENADEKVLLRLLDEIDDVSADLWELTEGLLTS